MRDGGVRPLHPDIENAALSIARGTFMAPGAWGGGLFGAKPSSRAASSLGARARGLRVTVTYRNTKLSKERDWLHEGK